ncbi:hypothetical protein [Anaerotignum sp.]|uniref:hypothetical protein n=1 Tax=Anaerotignum sp. TaxID=2039241 RepID=UPI0027145EF7|nr:hypothetical protein [Anaerotignum sp.]
MEYTKSQKYNTPELMAKIMGPNPFKLQEEMLQNHEIPDGSSVCDLGSGQGLTSVMLAKDYGFKVYAADLKCLKIKSWRVLLPKEWIVSITLISVRKIGLSLNEWQMRNL